MSDILNEQARTQGEPRPDSSESLWPIERPAPDDRVALYDWAARCFLYEYLVPYGPAVPDLTGDDARTFIWDTFCSFNARLIELFTDFLERESYELSERQCSWACGMYCFLLACRKLPMPVRAGTVTQSVGTEPNRAEADCSTTKTP